MLTDNSFENLSNSVVDIAESFTIQVLKRIAKIAERIAVDPNVIININRIISEIEVDHERFLKQSKSWVDETLSVAYLRGLKESESQIKKLSPDLVASSLVFAGQGGIISPKAAKILSNYPQHHTMYSVFQDAAYNDFAKTRIPVVRDTRGKIRELIIQSSEANYTGADEFTRRQLSQDLINRFADNNITGITYQNGRTVNLDSYAEMVARSQTGNAAREASMRRQEEYGLDLVRISVHYPCSDLCEPYQGHVYSISGTSEQYPSLDSTNPGSELFHGNCKHFQNPFIPGVSGKQEIRQEQLGKRENRRRYELEQSQRYNERQIKKWKRREATALTDKEAEKSSKKVQDWQARNRELVKENGFLRRKYYRESIN